MSGACADKYGGSALGAEFCTKEGKLQNLYDCTMFHRATQERTVSERSYNSYRT